MIDNEGLLLTNPQDYYIVKLKRNSSGGYSQNIELLSVKSFLELTQNCDKFYSSHDYWITKVDDDVSYLTKRLKENEFLRLFGCNFSFPYLIKHNMTFSAFSTKVSKAFGHLI